MPFHIKIKDKTEGPQSSGSRSLVHTTKDLLFFVIIHSLAGSTSWRRLAFTTVHLVVVLVVLFEDDARVSRAEISIREMRGTEWRWRDGVAGSEIWAPAQLAEDACRLEQLNFLVFRKRLRVWYRRPIGRVFPPRGVRMIRSKRRSERLEPSGTMLFWPKALAPK